MRLRIQVGLLAAAWIGAVGASSTQACDLGMRIVHKLSPANAVSPKLLSDTDNAPPHEPTAVGLWESTFTGADGSTFVGFESIYADGNELLIDNSAPATDNVCSGVWEQTGSRTYRINHPSWDFDTSGNLTGIVVLSETITVDAKGNKYTGTGTVTVYDPTLSTVVYEVSGTLTAGRITARSKPL
ncbi:MAG: hypothetical protein JO061_01355 [Acidobacteriaceae bacterium]|nr:hypothetical protein [Acidobacteriaceae bacterium]